MPAVINSQFTIAIHVLSMLSLEKRCLSSAYIAGSVNTNPVVIRRIIHALQDAGFVETQMGVEGGTSLIQEPGQVTLLDVYYATQQNGGLFAMHKSAPNVNCPCGGHIQEVLAPIYREANDAMLAVLAQYTIADVADNILARAESVF